MREMNNGFYRSADGTRWVKDKPKEKAPRPRQTGYLSNLIMPFLTGEAEGDVTLAILLATRNLIRTPEHWCNIHRAMGANGLVSEPCSNFATRWNTLGALCAVTSGGLESYKRDIVSRWKIHLPIDYRNMLGIWEARKECRHSEVIRVLNLAVGVRKAELK